jgi:pyruvate dehydrogenase E2 component (dihydrolipoamide acetyltransferase)
MAIEIIVPRLGWSMEEGKFVAWLKQDGESVRAGEALFSIEGDKAVQEIESIDSGLLRIAPSAPAPGETIHVGDILGYLLSAGEALPDATPSPKVTDRGTIADQSIPNTASAPISAFPQARPTPAISPRALRVATELGVDWSMIRGSGRTGRIREKDIRGAVTRPTAAPLPSMREAIARRMLQSVRSTAPVTLHTTACADGLVRLRHHVKAAAGNSSAVVPSYTDMLVKLAAAALELHPALNASWDNDNLVPSSSIHIGVAVDTEAGLLVPVIRDVPRFSLREIASRSLELITRARARKLSADEMQGGTFTVTSLGSFGIDAFTPIINYPQCAILGVGRILRQPVADANNIVLRDIISLSLTFDHRALDGAPAARFLQTLCGLIEKETGDPNMKSHLLS